MEDQNEGSKREGLSFYCYFRSLLSTYENWVVGQGHGHQGKGVQKVNAIGHIGEGLRVHLLFGVTDILQNVLAVGSHENGRRSRKPGQTHEMVVAAGKAVQRTMRMHVVMCRRLHRHDRILH